MSQEIVLDATTILKMLPEARTGLIEMKNPRGEIIDQYYLERENGVDQLYFIEGGLPTPEEMARVSTDGKRYTTDDVLAHLESLRKRALLHP